MSEQDPPNGGEPNGSVEPIQTVEVFGREMPLGHKIPPGGGLWDGEDDGICRVLWEDGRRCSARRMRRWGICPGHAGVGGVNQDPRGMAKRAGAARAARREQRLLLGISARRGAQPVQAARLRAAARADALASAIVDGPLDDPDLGTLGRQRAAISAVELLFPQVSASLEVELPEDEAGAQAMGWQDMQALASRLLADD